MEKWETPGLFAENQMAPHVCFPEERVSLSGKWRFLCQSADTPLPDGWTEPEFSDRKWRRIPVPGSWEASELCPPFFYGDSLPPACSDGSGFQIDPRLNLVGLYRRSFLLSKDQGSRQILLRIGSFRSCVLVWLNGTYIGMAKGTGASAEFDITGAVRTDKNVICIQVLRYTDAVALESREQWRTSGILGDVELYTLPARCITDISADIRWSETDDAALTIGVRTRNAEGFTARIALMDGNQVVRYCESPVAENQAQAVLNCKGIRLWNAETPKLYRIAVILWDGVAMYHAREYTVGFRTGQVRNGTVFINDQPEKLYAVRYCPFDPETGCFPAAQTMEQTFRTLREHHFNSIILSAPAPEELYALCDRIGLYVLDASTPENAPESMAAYADELHNRFSATHSLHPCILCWNLPREDRGILPHSAFFRWKDPDPGQIRRFLGLEAPEDKPAGFLRRKSAIPVSPEIPENHSVLLEFSRWEGSKAEEIIRLIRSSPRLAGGVFGCMQDTVFLGQTAPGTEQGLCSPGGSLRPGLREAKQALHSIELRFEESTLTATNRSCFLHPEEMEATYALTLDGTEMISKTLELYPVPGETTSIPIETRYDVYRPGRYHLNVEYRRKDTGEEIAAGQWEIACLKHIYDESPGGTIREDAGLIHLRAQDVTYVIDRASGALTQIRTEGGELLNEEASPVFSLITEGQTGLHIPDEWEKLTSRKKKLKPSVLEVDHMTRTVTASFRLGSGMMQTFRLCADGSLAVELRLRTGKTTPDRIGLRFAMPAAMRRFRWFGLGPDHTNQTQRLGRFFAIHEQTAADPDSAFGAKEPVYHMQMLGDESMGLGVRCDEGLRASAEFLPDAAVLTVELPVEQRKPHTTYTLSFSIFPIK